MRRAIVLLLAICLSIRAQGNSHSVTLSWTWSQGTGDLQVVAGATYYYVITAFNSGGDSPYSNQVTAVIPFQVPSSAPVGLTATVK